MIIGSLNLANLFAPAKALNTKTWTEAEPALKASKRFNAVAKKLSSASRQRRHAERPPPAAGAVPHPGRSPAPGTQHRPPLARPRENRGDFLKQPERLHRQLDPADLLTAALSADLDASDPRGRDLVPRPQPPGQAIQAVDDDDFDGRVREARKEASLQRRRRSQIAWDPRKCPSAGQAS